MQFLVSSPDFIKHIPHEPGVYRFYALADSSSELGELLYVGKALDLYKRVKSYFQKSQALSPRISLMVSKIHKIEITLTENEVSALILENNLIKSLKPKYNIIFRDDKSYPLIRLSGHAYPKLDSFRGKPNNSKCSYFGPYPNSTAVRQNIDMIGRIFKLRTCSDNVLASRVRPCILYEIKRCTAPCVNLVSEADYHIQVTQAIDFLNGKFALVIDNLSRQMYDFADKMEFEQAALIRDRLGLIKHISANQIINNYNEPLSADLILCDTQANKVLIYLIILRNGLYIGDKHFVLDNVDDDVNSIVEIFLENYYLENRNTKHIYTEFNLSLKFKALFFKAFAIKIGYSSNQQVQKLYQMGRINLHKITLQSPRGFELAADKLAKLLDIQSIKRIECIDISHNHGEDTVASLVVYQNGIIDHAKYRKYNLQLDSAGNPINGNDILAMEVVLRRRLANSEMELPELILVDGGKLQLETLKMVLIDMGLYDKIRLLALFKGERRDPLFDRLLFEDGRIISYEASMFGLLQELRDEAHRFAITGHRKRQIKKMTISILSEIPNLGVQKKRALLAHFGSVKAIANAKMDELKQVNGIGDALADQIYSFFH
jgi:excinuclease ABC subunit C